MERMMDFFIENDFNFAISWDGRNSIETRGYDAFKDNKELIFKNPNLCVSAVLSAYAYPKQICEDFQELDNEYFLIHNHHLRLNIDDIFNTGCLPEDLLNINYTEVSNQILELSMVYLKDKQNNIFPKEHYAINNYIGSLYNSVKRYYVDGNCEWNNEWCCCGIFHPGTERCRGKERHSRRSQRREKDRKTR